MICEGGECCFEDVIMNYGAFVGTNSELFNSVLRSESHLTPNIFINNTCVTSLINQTVQLLENDIPNLYTYVIRMSWLNLLHHGRKLGMRFLPEWVPLSFYSPICHVINIQGIVFNEFVEILQWLTYCKQDQKLFTDFALFFVQSSWFTQMKYTVNEDCGDCVLFYLAARFLHYWPFVRGVHRSPVDSPHTRPVMRTFDISFNVNQNKQMNKQSSGWWFETSRNSCDVTSL